MLKIVLTGAESTGKTTLAQRLARHFQTVWVPEFARSYLHNLGRPYEQADLLDIAKGQIALEEQQALKTKGLLFCDTGLEVIEVWSRVRFGYCHSWIQEQLSKRRGDLYLLCSPDLPWEFDPLREHPLDRWALHEMYRRQLGTLSLPWVEVRGLGEERFHRAVAFVDDLLTTRLADDKPH